MLYILYGTLDDVNYESRKYFESHGIAVVEKFNYSENPQLFSTEKPRPYVSREEFYQNTDSLFRYEIGGIQVGFHYQQISDAVCDACDRLLTLSTDNIGFLAEIKRVYGDSVCLIYSYIDNTTLNKIINKKVVENYADDNSLSDDERKKKMRKERKARKGIAISVKKSYLKYRHIFDYVVMYGGEESEFNIETLCLQYKSIIEEQRFEDAKIEYGDVFIISTQEQRDLHTTIYNELKRLGIKVFDDSQLAEGVDCSDKIRDAIRNAELVVAIVSNHTVQNDLAVNEFLSMVDEGQRCGAKVVPVVMEGVPVSDFPSIADRLNPWDIELKYNEQFGGLAEKINFMLRFEKELAVYAGQVENYLGLKMYEKAKECQERHLALCERACEGPYMKFDEFVFLTSSKLKYAEILLKLEKREDAIMLLEEHIESCNQVCENPHIKPKELTTLTGYRLKYAEFLLKMGEPKDTDEYEKRYIAVYNICAAAICDIENTFKETGFDRADRLYLDALELFACSCVVLAADEENAVWRLENATDTEYWKDESDEFKNSLLGQHLQWREDYVRKMYRKFMDEDYFNSAMVEEAESFVRAASAEQNDIAKHGEQAVELFERIIQADAKGMNKFDLIDGYERVLDYCRYIGLQGAIPDECIRRIGELNMYDSSADDENAVADESLKIYLGCKKPETGGYDVFISFKSQDEQLAQKVYKYLMQSGKVAFFSRATLPQIGESKYEKAIFEAIDNSKHMVVVATDPEYLKTEWVKKEWSRFAENVKKAEDSGLVKNLLLILDDKVAGDKDKRPDELKEGIEIIRTSEFRSRLLGYIK